MIRRVRSGRPFPWTAYAPDGTVMQRTLPSGGSIAVGGQSLTAAKFEVDLRRGRTMSALLRWQPAATDEPRDQTADTELVAHGYWSLGPHARGWIVELIEQNDDLTEIDGIPVTFLAATEADAKQSAESWEAAQRPDGAR